MSPTAMVRQGGAWVQSSATGRVRLGGVDIPFLPPGGGTSDEWFTFPTPVNPDWPDSNTNVAVRFGVTTAGDFMGLRYWRPATYSAGGTVFGMNHDTLTVIASPVAEPVGGTLGAFVDLLFTTPVAITPGVNYLACYHTSRYGFTRVSEGATVPFFSQTSKIYSASPMSEVAMFRFGGELTGGAFTPSPNFHFNISPIVRFTA